MLLLLKLKEDESAPVQQNNFGQYLYCFGFFVRNTRTNYVCDLDKINQFNQFLFSELFTMKEMVFLKYASNL